MIGLIASLISITGIIFLGLLLCEIHLKSRERHLKKHRQNSAGLADLLNYAAVVDDGVIVCKNGSFMAAWLYQGEDNANTTDEAREMVSFRINQALSAMGNGWMVHVDAVRRAAPGYSERGLSHFQDPLSLAIDEERRQLFESIFCPDDRPSFRLALNRGYIDSGLCPGGYGYLMKKVVATTGDEVSVTSVGVFVNQRLVPYSKPKLKDGMNRRLPQWQALDYQLKNEELLTMTNQSEWSFDGRYYGPIRLGQLKGVITPIWVKKYEQ